MELRYAVLLSLSALLLAVVATGVDGARGTPVFHSESLSEETVNLNRKVNEEVTEVAVPIDTEQSESTVDMSEETLEGHEHARLLITFSEDYTSPVENKNPKHGDSASP